MNMYEEPIGQNRNNDDAFTKLRNIERNEEAIMKRNNNSETGISLTREQIHQLKDKYDLLHMTCEEEEMFMKDLNEMGILTKKECGSYLKSEGNIFESLTKQVRADIYLLYQMAIAGRYSSLHIEHIKSQQKILDILEQLLAG